MAVISLTIGVLLTLGLGVLFVSQVGAVLHLLAVLGAALTGIGLFYNAYQARLLEIESEALAIITYAALGTAAGFLVFRILEAVLAALSFGAALVVALLVVASVVFSPQLVFNVVAAVIEAVLSLGDN